MVEAPEKLSWEHERLAGRCFPDMGEDAEKGHDAREAQNDGPP